MSGTYLAQPRAYPDESVKGRCFSLLWPPSPHSQVRKSPTKNRRASLQALSLFFNRDFNAS